MSEHNIPTPHIAAQAGEIAETILYREIRFGQNILQIIF